LIIDGVQLIGSDSSEAGHYTFKGVMKVPPTGMLYVPPPTSHLIIVRVLLEKAPFKENVSILGFWSVSSLENSATSRPFV